MTTGSVIVDLKGLVLDQEEVELIKHPSVAGVLLFSRNYETEEQLRELTQSIHAARPGLIIAVDQEGGRIQRFREGFTALPAMRYWGNFYAEEPQEAIEDLHQMTVTMATELQSVGVNMSFSPVLDIDHGLSDVISDRSFGSDPELCSILGDVVISSMKHAGMKSIAKHFPGHGSVVSDSHHEVSVDQRSREEIWNTDLLPFKQLANKYDAVMPAHIIYPLVDDNVVTYSHYWLQTILRDQLGFNGVIMSDDLTMFAASQVGDYSVRAEAAYAAGCDLLIAANNREGAIDILHVSEKVSLPKTNQRLENFLASFAQEKIS
jgi:beta-N-acetylhexosaminidase